MTKLNDVARHAGVGVGTASRALTGNGYVEASTRERVLASARLLDYRPNAVAKALRERRTGVVGLALPDISNEFYTSSASVLQTELDRAGVQLLVASTGNDPDRELRVLRTLADRQVDGLVHVPVSSTPPPGLPTVQLNRHTATAGVRAVLCDDEQGIAALTRHVIDAGHRRLAVIGGPRHLSTSRERLAGFRRAVQESDPAAGVTTTEIEVPFTVDGGSEAMAGLLAEVPDAVVALSPRIALGVLRVCSDRGLTVPERLSLVAYGNPDWYDLGRPGITAFAPPLEEMGRAAARQILAMLSPADASDEEPLVVRLPGEVVLRGSVALR